MAAEVATISDMTFVDRTVGVRNSAPPDILSLQSGIACAVTFKHDLGVDMSRTRYTGAGKFCMPVTDVQLGRFRNLAGALTVEYVPNPSAALPNAAFDYKFVHQGVDYAGSYRYDGGADFDRSLAPFDALVRDIVKNGDAVASIDPHFRVSRVASGLAVDLMLENTGKVGAALTGVSEWVASSESPAAEGVTFLLSRDGNPVIMGSLLSGNYDGDSSLLGESILVAAGEIRSLRFIFPLDGPLDGNLPPGRYVASGSLKIDADFAGGVSGRMNTPVNAVEVQISAE